MITEIIFYRIIWNFQREVRGMEMGKTKEFLKKRFKNPYVLDVGTGLGGLVNEFLEIFPEGNFIGIESDETVFEHYKKHGEEPAIEIKIMDAEKMDFEDNSFDIVILSNTFHHIKNKGKIFDEIKRVLKNDGVFILGEMRSDDLSQKQKNHRDLHHLSAEIDMHNGIYHENTYTEEEIVDFVSEFFDVLLTDYLDYESDVSDYTDMVNRLRDILDKKIDNLDIGIDEKNSLSNKADEILENILENGKDIPTMVILTMKK
jgi:ubiquinone/menaquinone biosynthesis C-methylase UbiE